MTWRPALPEPPVNTIRFGEVMLSSLEKEDAEIRIRCQNRDAAFNLPLDWHHTRHLDASLG